MTHVRHNGAFWRKPCIVGWLGLLQYLGVKNTVVYTTLARGEGEDLRISYLLTLNTLMFIVSI
jgi:hypothetical protein